MSGTVLMRVWSSNVLSIWTNILHKTLQMIRPEYRTLWGKINIRAGLIIYHTFQRVYLDLIDDQTLSFKHYFRYDCETRHVDLVHADSFLQSYENIARKKESRLTRISLSIVWLFIICHVWKLIPTVYELIYSEVSAFEGILWAISCMKIHIFRTV